MIGRCSPPPATAAGEQREILNVPFQFPRHFPRDVATGSKSEAPGTRCLTPPCPAGTPTQRKWLADFRRMSSQPRRRFPSFGGPPGAKHRVPGVSLSRIRGRACPDFRCLPAGVKVKPRVPGARRSTPRGFQKSITGYPVLDFRRPGFGTVVLRISAGRRRSGLKVKHRVPGA